MTREAWEQWENEIQQRWGLDSTPGSGNKFNDPGDAVDHRNPHDESFRLEVDCKDTIGKSYTLSKLFMGHWTKNAEERGKRFVLALRFRERDHPRTPHQEYVVLSRNDFEELLEKADHWDKSNIPGRDVRAIDRTWGD